MWCLWCTWSMILHMYSFALMLCFLAWGRGPSWSGEGEQCWADREAIQDSTQEQEEERGQAEVKGARGVCLPPEMQITDTSFIWLLASGLDCIANKNTFCIGGQGSIDMRLNILAASKEMVPLYCMPKRKYLVNSCQRNGVITNHWISSNPRHAVLEEFGQNHGHGRPYTKQLHTSYNSL